MARYFLAFLGLLMPLSLAVTAEAKPPLALHPDNPHYFLFRGKPTILLTSGEHYGAVLNRDFAYVRYLDELKRCEFNQTRTFSGTYFEVAGSFKIVANTLAPTAKAYIGPWPRGDQPGAADGGNKFDLTRWDPAYFARLKDFVGQAGQRGIVVEMVLFCPLYDDQLWQVSPMRAANNVNGIGKVGRTDVFALKEKALTDAQEAVARKIVSELKDFDNVYFEVCNEPYFGGVTRAWQDRIIDVIVDADQGGQRHLIAQNIANGAAKIDKPNPHVSIFNFHYATPPTTVGLNYHLNRPLGDDETGFRGTGDRAYRTEAWDFLVAGGAAYSNLDYSFSCAHPDGTMKVTTSPGGGGIELRRQLTILKRLLEGFDFLRMKPANAILRGHKITPEAMAKGAKPGPVPTARVLAEAGKQYLVYVRGGVAAELTLDLPAGSYRAEWLDPRTGKVTNIEFFRHQGDSRTLTAPPYREDIALSIRRQETKPAEQFKALLKEYQFAASGGVFSDAERMVFIGRVFKHRNQIAQKFVELAEANPQDPIALDALIQATWQVNTIPWPVEIAGQDEAGKKALAILQRDHVRSAKLGPVCQRISFGFCKEYETFLRMVLQHNPHQDIQALACLGLAQFLSNRSWRLDLIKEQPALAKEFADLFGKEYLAALQRQDRAQAIQEAATFFEQAAAKYGAVKIANGTTVAAKAQAGLFAIRRLGVGMVAPDIEGEDQHGQRFKLSDYRGKVVLLDFWHQQ